MKACNWKYFVSLLFLLLIPLSLKAQINIYYPNENVHEMRKFADNVMTNPDSIYTYIATASKYFDYNDFLKSKDVSSIIRIIKKYKKCKYDFFSMCKHEINYSQSNTIIYGTSILYRNYCEEKVIQFFWILEDSKWKLYSIIKTDYISCYPKEDTK